MTTQKKIQIDFEYEEILDAKTRRLIQAGCAVAVLWLYAVIIVPFSG